MREGHAGKRLGVVLPFLFAATVPPAAQEPVIGSMQYGIGIDAPEMSALNAAFVDNRFDAIEYYPLFSPASPSTLDFDHVIVQIKHANRTL